jgi:Na+/H+ antiporter NhaC
MKYLITYTLLLLLGTAAFFAFFMFLQGVNEQNRADQEREFLEATENLRHLCEITWPLNKDQQAECMEGAL